MGSMGLYRVVLAHIWMLGVKGFQKIRGSFFESGYSQNYSTLGSLWGPYSFGDPHIAM